MKSILSVSFVLCFVLITSVCGADLPSFPATDGQVPILEVISSDENGFSVEYTFRDLSWGDVALDGQSFQSVSILGGGIVGELGEPALPTFGRLLALPDRSGFRVRITRLEEEDIHGVRLAPVQSGQGDGFSLNPVAYSEDRFDSLDDVVLGEPALIRGLRVANLRLQPVHYNPAQQVLRVVRKMRVDVVFEGENLLNVPTTHRQSIPPSFQKMYESLVVNYDASTSGRSASLGTYLVICANNSGVISRLQPLLDWRQRMGYQTVLATTAETGTSTAQIKNYIQNAYDNWEVPLEFVVLAGDATGSYAIPTWFENLSGYHGEGDHPYTTLEGNDILADVHIGRLSFEAYTDLELIVEKVLAYESNPALDDPGWFKRACLVGDPSSSGRSTIITNQWVKERLLDLNYTEIDTVWAEPFVSQMVIALNKGGTVFCYRGFLGMSGWSNGLSESLGNGTRMPFAVVITCDTGSFASGTARSEGFLRAGSPGDPGGAVASIGTATIGTHTRYNNCMQYGILRGLLEEGLHQTGAALTRGKLEVYLNYNEVEPAKAEIWAHWNNLMGDPAIDIYSGFPTPLVVTHESIVSFGANSIVVEVNSGLAPVEGALVCAWKNGESHAAGYTDAEGLIELPLTDLSIGDLLITVTDHDRFPYLATVPVQGSAVYLGYNDSSIDDDGNGTSQGNGDSRVNPGETIELPVQLKNFGLGSASDVTATLTTNDPLITILDDAEDYGSVGGNATVWSPDDFDFVVDPRCTDGQLLQFSFDVTSGAEQWHSLIEISVVAPALTVDATHVYDGGNSRLDPGETVELSVVLLNQGGAMASGITTTLASETPFITVQDATGVIGDIGVGGSGENLGDHFTLTADPSTYEGYLAALSLVTVYSGGLADTLELTLQVGERSSDDPIGPDIYGYIAFDDTDISYPEAPEYNWVEIDTDEGGSGQQVTLGDFGTYQDKSVVVDIPFTFQYYGERYDRATICSNGWLAMGSTYLTSYRNWTIPGAGGPDAMIAPFWDDLLETSGAEVYQWYDTANHRWIIEWSRMRNDYNGALETFEIILYDPAHHITDTGDGRIVFQYHTVSISDPVDGYVTVGIENHDQDDGILYTYFNRYASGAAPLLGGRAITFEPTAGGPLGSLSGQVVNASHNETPISGAQVLVVERGRVFTTGPDGSYTGLVPAETYTVVGQHVGFAPDTTYGVFVEEGQVAQVDFSLVDIAGPAITSTQHPSTDNNVGPYPISITIVEPSGLAETKLYYRVNWGEFIPLDLQAVGGDNFIAQIPGQGYTTLVEYYVYARDEVGFESTAPEGAPTELYSFIVGPFLAIVEEDFESEGGWTAGAPGDDASTGIWVRADPVGTSENGTVVQPEDDHTPDSGFQCFITGNGNPGDTAGREDVDGGRTTLLSPVFDLTDQEGASVEYWYWYSNHTGSDPGADSWVVEVTDDGSTWTALQNTTQNTAEQWVQTAFLLDDYIEMTDQVQFRFIASDLGGGSLVEAGVDDFVLRSIQFTVGIDQDESALTLGLGSNWPNPANPITQISYRLPTSTNLKIAVYDVSGRLVRSLFDGAQEPGQHVVEWDGKSDSTEGVATGIYFLRFETPNYVEVRQIALVR